MDSFSRSGGHKCDFCGRVFADPEELDDHLGRHQTALSEWGDS